MFRKVFPTCVKASTRVVNSRAFSTADETKKVAFGFQSVDEAIKQTLVNGVFHNVASKYDIMNDVMSAGVHRLWKDQFVRTLDAPVSAPGKDRFKVLDVAGGTGDIAFKIVDAAKERRALSATPEHQLPHVTICDINESMLKHGEIRAKAEGRFEHEFVVGSGEALPFPDESMDAVTISFGIRNFTHIDKGLKEFYRVLKPGGRFLCLEFSRVDTPVVKDVYDFYSFNVIPPMGSMVAGDAESYRYLVESIRKFPPQEQFASMIHEAGFRHVSYTNMTFGVVAMHSGFKLPKSN